MYHSILVPLDGSLPSEQSLPFAAAIARRSEASLQIVYVHSPLVVGEGVLYLGTPDVQLWGEETAYVRGVVERLHRAGLQNVTARVLEGPIAGALQEHAIAEGNDLVVMTTHGRGPISRFWLGSVADQLVHRLPMPLLLIRTQERVPPRESDPRFRNVLIALDGTPTAEQILEPAGVLAKLMGAAFTLVRVVPPILPQNAGETLAPVGIMAVDTLRARAQFYLNRVADSLREKGMPVQTRIISHPHPATAILEEAATGDYDLLALETHARRGLPRLFLGSVADKVVRGASVPILVHRCLPD